MKLDGSTALITGASAGLGSEFARQLASRAQTLILVARREERLQALRAELEGRPPWRRGSSEEDATGRDSARPSRPRIEIRVVDLAKHKSVSDLCAWLEQESIVVDLLINNAGLGDRGSFGTSEFGRVNDMAQVNVVSLTLLTHRLLPAMIARKRGAILNVSSCASFMPMPGFAVYAATKAYVTSFSEALRMELRGTGVRVEALCPGPVHTEFDTVAMRPDAPKQAAPEFTYVAAEEVVRDGLAGIENDRAIVIPGLAMKIGMFLVRLTPMPVLRVAARLAK